MKHKVIYYPQYWGGKKLAYPHVAPEKPKFSKSVVVDNLIFISGCQGMNDETATLETHDFAEQMIIALNKVKGAMEEAGSSMNNVIKTLILLRDREHYPIMRRTEFEFYQKYAPMLVENPPASTIMYVGLGKPDYLVEIDVVGVISRS